MNGDGAVGTTDNCIIVPSKCDERIIVQSEKRQLPLPETRRTSTSTSFTTAATKGRLLEIHTSKHEVMMMMRGCSVKDLVALCQYVAEADRQDGQEVPVESFRKKQWKQRREAERALAMGAAADESAQPHVDMSATNESQNSMEPAVTTSADDEDSEGVDDDDHHPVLRLDEFLNEFIASEVDVTNIQSLPAKPSDPLGAISTPSRREGHSVTLCRVTPTDLVVVFGGRWLRDLTNLLPVAVNRIEPLKLERVRYAFSNGVYSYDTQTTLWTLRQCSGKPPKERSDHSAVYATPHFLVVFGGRGKSGQLFNDCFVLSLRHWHWVELDTRTRPTARYWHGCCLTSGYLYILGGKSESDVYGDLQQFNIQKAVDALLLQEAKEEKDRADAIEGVPPPPQSSRLQVPLSWVAPHVVGKPPSARFGLRMVRIGHDRIAVVGGWRPPKRRKRDAPRTTAARTVDVYLLDTMTMVWTKPQFSSHLCALRAPPERFNFECLFAQRSIILFGGFTYSNDGQTEYYTVRNDDRRVIYKLDVHRMIWRRQELELDEARLLMTEYPAFSSNAVLRGTGGNDPMACYLSVARSDELQLGLSTLSLHRRSRESNVVVGE